MGGRACAVQGDLADAQAVARLVPEAASRLGRALTMLVNNASEFEPDALTALDPEQWERHFAINLRAPAFLVRDFARQCPDGADGLVVNMLDQRVWKPTPHFFSYQLTKSALWTATQTMAQALAPRGIRVQRDRAGADRLEYTPGRCGFPQADGGDTAEARCHAGRNRQGRPLPCRDAGHDGPDARPRWRPASGLGDAGCGGDPRMNIIPSSRVRRLVEIIGPERDREPPLRLCPAWSAATRGGMYKTVLGEAGACSAWRLTSHGQRIFA